MLDVGHAQLAPRTNRSEAYTRSREQLEDSVAKAIRTAAVGPRLLTESTVVHFVQAHYGPAGIRNVPDHMCVKGERILKDGSGNQTPLGGKFTRTCPRGENCGAF